MQCTDLRSRFVNLEVQITSARDCLRRLERSRIYKSFDLWVRMALEYLKLPLSDAQRRSAGESFNPGEQLTGYQKSGTQFSVEELNVFVSDFRFDCL